MKRRMNAEAKEDPLRLGCLGVGGWGSIGPHRTPATMEPRAIVEPYRLKAGGAMSETMTADELRDLLKLEPNQTSSARPM
jgi:hypothetical protein